MTTVLRRVLQAISLLLLIVAVVLAGHSGFTADSAGGSIALMLLAAAVLGASRVVSPGVLLRPADSGDSSPLGSEDLHRANVLLDDRHGTSDP